MAQQALHAVGIDTFAEEQRGRAVPQVVEAHRAYLRGRPQLHRAARAGAELAVCVALAVGLSAALAAAAGVDPVVDQAGARERSAKHFLRVGFRRAHPAVAAGEHEFAGRARERLFEERDERLGDRDRVRVPALRGLAVVGPAHRDRPVVQVHVALRSPNSSPLRRPV
ncbi:MAG: hypothetical protein AUG04_07155 [Deltaproteobacteria bacterium 13_1_20CM_2_69_21]|nr:MAG: hypothetical protein AUG04_07155 [Deltaproteobacteria bacterium 13_1_20CM_2_69_21]